MSTPQAILRILGAIPMPVSHSMAALIGIWLSLGIPHQIIVAMVIDLLIGGDASHLIDQKKQADADSLAQGITDKTDTAAALKLALSRHAIVQHWARWERVVRRIKERAGSLTRDQLAEIYERFCAGEMDTSEDIDRILDALLHPVAQAGSDRLGVPPSDLGVR
ncbi:hypothetical protein [Lysobacter capsici]|uniref:hypothetical protein n=1 Tax=Lysobacter capsici TaxID=435897 RepID=UPI0012908476|nr:hypothetical protein [Lysobacter capsici]